MIESSSFIINIYVDYETHKFCQQIVEDVHSVQQTSKERKLQRIRRILQDRWWHVDPSRIDIVARRLFPVVFIIFNIVYWVTYRYS